MGDGESSSRGGGGGGGKGDTVVIDYGRRRSSCGYCRSTDYTSISHGLSALSITAYDYQELLDRGWRRSGSFLYKPEMEKMCCPSYTIRLKANDFVPSKEQVRVYKKMQRFLDGKIDVKKPDRVNDKQNSPKGLFNVSGDASSATVSALSTKETSASLSQLVCKEEEFINYLSNKIDEAVVACLGNGECPTVQLPNAIVKKVTLQAKKKLLEISEDLLYTSNIAFPIAAALRNSRPTEKKIAQTGLLSNTGQNGELMSVTPNIISEKLACFIDQHQEPSGLLVRACNGHLNFYSATKEASLVLDTSHAHTKTLKGSESDSKRSLVTDTTASLAQKRRKLDIHMKRSSFDPEEFALYKKYQIKVHGDKPEKVTESSYRGFLVDTPIIFIPPCSGNKTIPPCGFGSFHQQYVIDGKLVAVGVVDILPRCLSSKYLFWDPDFAFLSLGKYSALQEINWISETQVHCHSLQYYYLGYYIHSCSKMRYKAAYHPSELLCPLRYKWVPFDVARPLLDKKSYVILSDFSVRDNQAPSPQVLGTSGQLGYHLEYDDTNEVYRDDGKADLDYEVSDTWSDDESGLEVCSTSITDDVQVSDISNIIIDLNGSRVKFKDLQQVFGPIEKRHVDELQMQLHRYVKVVGKELSTRMIYSLG